MTTTTTHIDEKCLACKQPLSAEEIEYWLARHSSTQTEPTVIKVLCRHCWSRYRAGIYPVAK